jgi:hypothetical protein
MADAKLTGLSAITAVVPTDLVYVVTNVATTPASNKVTVGNFLLGWIPRVVGTTGRVVTFGVGGLIVDSGHALSEYSVTGHNHAGTYLPVISGTSGNVLIVNSAGTAVEDSGHALSEYSVTGHNHAGTYLPVISGTSGNVLIVNSAGTAVEDSGVTITSLPSIVTSTGVPSSTPSKKGDINVANTGDIYIAKGTTGAGSWICLTNNIVQ